MNYFCSLYSSLIKLNLFKQKNFFLISIFTISFIFIFYPITFSQVKIKESVVITPNSISIKHLNSVANSSHTIRLVGEWDQTMLGEDEDIPLNRQRFKIRTSCSDDIYSPPDFSGHTEFSFTAEYGNSYNIQFLNAQRTLWDPIYRDEGVYGGQFEVYVDGQYFTTANNSIDITPWFSSLGFQIYGSEIYHESSVDISFVKVPSCGPIIGSMSDGWPEISILKGGEFLSFYDEENEDTLGDSFYFGDFISNTPKLLYDNPYYKDGDLNGILKAELNGIAEYDTLKINKVEDFELIVEIEPEELRPGESADIHLLQDLGFDQEEFPPEQLFKVEIIDGGQYGTIVAPNGIDTSDVFDDILQGFTFRASENIIDSAEVYIKVSTILENEVIIVSRDHSDKSEMNKTMTITKNDAVNPDLENTVLSGNNPNWIFFPPEDEREIYGIGKVKIFCEDSLDHFELSIKPDSLAIRDTIAFTESAKLFVISKNADSNTIEIDTSKLLRFEITSKDEYGTFITPSGDTLNSSQTVLSNISYGKAKAGKVRFAALFENPDSIVNCNIKVTLQDDTTKKGEREAVVLEQTLKIIMDGRHEVQPIITRRKNDPACDTYLGQIGDTNRIGFRTKITRGGKVLKKHSIKLWSNYIDGTGGHNHVLPRRPSDAFTFIRSGVTVNVPSERARRQNYGSFFSYRSGATFDSDSMKGMVLTRPTQDTVSRFEYIASIWGDSMKIFLKSIENPLLSIDSVKIIERIPNLDSIGEGADYTLTGGREEHHGPPTYQTDQNHFGTAVTINNIRNIASDYRQRFNLLLVINDMSLPNGGKFDIEGEWRGSHATHREGKNVDIRSRDIEGDRYIDANRNGIFDPENNQNERLVLDNNSNGVYDGEGIEVFREICESNNAHRILLENPNSYNGYAEHWHLEF